MLAGDLRALGRAGPGVYQGAGALETLLQITAGAARCRSGEARRQVPELLVALSALATGSEPRSRGPRAALAIAAASADGEIRHAAQPPAGSR